MNSQQICQACGHKEVRAMRGHIVCPASKNLVIDKDWTRTSNFLPAEKVASVGSDINCYW